MNEFKFITKNSLRNYVYLCAINSKAGNNSQCFQYSRTLQSVIEEVLELKKFAGLHNDSYIDQLIYTLAKQGIHRDSKITGRIISFAFYYSGKSLVNLKNTPRSRRTPGLTPAYLDYLSHLAHHFSTDQCIKILHGRLHKLIDSQQTAGDQAIDRPLTKIVIRGDAAKPPAAGKQAMASTRQLLDGRRSKAMPDGRPSRVAVDRDRRQTSAGVGVVARKASGNDLAFEGQKEVRTFRFRSKDRARNDESMSRRDVVPSRAASRGNRDNDSNTSRSISNKLTRRPYHGIKKQGAKRMDIMFIGDPLVENIIHKANKALNLVSAANLGWIQADDQPAETVAQVVNTFFSGEPKNLISGPQQENKALSGMFLLPDSEIKIKQKINTLHTIPMTSNKPISYMQINKPPVYRPLVVLGDGGDYVMGEDENAVIDNGHLKQSKNEIEGRKFKEIKNKMLFQTIKFKKKELALDNDKNKGRKLLEIKKLIKQKRDNQEQLACDRWNKLSFEESMPDYISKFRTKKLQDLKSYIKANKPYANPTSEMSIANNDVIASMKSEGQNKHKIEGSISLEQHSSDLAADQLIHGLIKPYLQAALLSNSALDNAISKSELKGVLKPGSMIKPTSKLPDHNLHLRDMSSDKKISSAVKSNGYSLNIHHVIPKLEHLPEEVPIMSDRNEERSSSRYSSRKINQNVKFEINSSQKRGLANQGSQSRNRLRIDSVGSKDEKNSPRMPENKEKKLVNVVEHNNIEIINPSFIGNLQKSRVSGQQEATHTRSERQATDTADEGGQFESLEDLNEDEIYEVEDFLERLRVFFLAYYRHCASELNIFMMRNDTLATLEIIKKLTKNSKNAQSMNI